MDASTEPAADPREEEGALKSGPSLLPPPPHLDVLRAVQQPLVQRASRGAVALCVRVVVMVGGGCADKCILHHTSII